MDNVLKDLPEKGFLLPSEVARFLRISIATVYRWCEEGKLSSVRMYGIVRISRESVVGCIKNLSKN